MHPSGVQWCRRPIMMFTCLLVLAVSLQTVLTSRLTSPRSRHNKTTNVLNTSLAISISSSSNNNDHRTRGQSNSPPLPPPPPQQQQQQQQQRNTSLYLSSLMTTVTSYVDTPSGLEMDLQEVVTMMDEDEDEQFLNDSSSPLSSSTSTTTSRTRFSAAAATTGGGGGRRGVGGKNSQHSRSSTTTSTFNYHNNNNNHNYDHHRSYVSNCSRCRMLEETINVTKEAIKLQILSKLGLKVAPNITKRALPRIPPLENLLDQYGMQSDMAPTHTTFKPGPVYEEAEDDYHAKMEKIISFAQEPPSVWGLPSSLAIQYFKFSHAVMVNKVVRANLWVYLNPSRMLPEPYIWLHVYKVWRSDSNTSHVLQDHAMSAKVNIKPRKGLWVTVDIKKTVSDWFRNPYINLGIVVQAFDNEGRQLVATDRLDDTDSSLLPFLEVYVMDESKRRTKRMIGLNCEEKSQEVRCCRYPLKVDFEEFGWDWIIAPKTYEANYCSGECPFVFLQKYPHTHLVQQANPSGSAGPCCAPRKMSPISMLYFDHEFNIIYGLLPGMVVDRCGCS